MIYSVKGTLVTVEQNLAVVDVAGIGFGVKTTMTTLSRLPKIGEEAFLYTYMNVREDAIELFGFADAYELSCYKMLISVSGVGPKAALSILSDQTPEQFSMYVATGDAKGLTRSPGIGLKTAQRIVLELKDKVSQAHAARGVSGQDTAIKQPVGNAAEAIHALQSLGFSQSEAASVISGLDPAASIEEMIKTGLQKLSKNG